MEYKSFQIVLFWCGIVFECRIWYLLLKRHKGKRKTWKQIYKWTDRHKTYTSGFMAILRHKCISLFREYQFFFPNQKQKGSRGSKLMKILFSQCVSAEISYTIYILIFRYDWQGHRKQIRKIKCASCLHKTKCYSQGRDRLRLKLASSPQVKELLGK